MRREVGGHSAEIQTADSSIVVTRPSMDAWTGAPKAGFPFTSGGTPTT